MINSNDFIIWCIYVFTWRGYIVPGSSSSSSSGGGGGLRVFTLYKYRVSVAIINRLDSNVKSRCRSMIRLLFIIIINNNISLPSMTTNDDDNDDDDNDVYVHWHEWIARDSIHNNYFEWLKMSKKMRVFSTMFFNVFFFLKAKPYTELNLLVLKSTLRCFSFFPSLTTFVHS